MGMEVVDLKPVVEPPRKLVYCPSCSKGFARRAHMLRHVQQHTSEKPYLCHFCAKAFKRSDLLRDHHFRCERRGNAAVPARGEKGRKRRACDACQKVKARCEGEAENHGVCNRCKERGIICRRSVRVRQISESTEPQSPGGPELTNRDRSSIRFLLNDIGTSDFITKFKTPQCTATGSDIPDEWENVQDGKLEMSGVPTPREFPVWTSNHYDPFFGTDLTFDSLLGDVNSQLFDRAIFYDEQPPLDGVPNYLAHDLDADSPGNATGLPARVNDLKYHLRQSIVHMRLQEGTEPHIIASKAIEAFSASRVQHYVNLFFLHWYKHGPILHAPSFNTLTVPLHLLLAVACIGGMYAEDPQEVQNLKVLLDLAECYVFRECFPDEEYELQDSPEKSQQKHLMSEEQQLEELQGAYLIVMVQYWAGNRKARRRARQQRFMSVLSMARKLKLPTSQHNDTLPIYNEEGFRRWVHRESCIRTMNIMMMLDSAFNIFNNLPPRFDLSEIDLDLPCENIYFEVRSYQEMRMRGCFPPRKVKITQAFESLFCTPSPLQSGELNAMDLHTLIHLLYNHTWSTLLSNPLANLLPPTPAAPYQTLSQILHPIETALHNWEAQWNAMKAGISPRKWAQMGFQCLGESYWLLARCVVVSFARHGGRGRSARGGSGAGVMNDPLSAAAVGMGLLPEGVREGEKGWLPIRADCDDVGAHLRGLMEGTGLDERR